MENFKRVKVCCHRQQCINEGVCRNLREHKESMALVGCFIQTLPTNVLQNNTTMTICVVPAQKLQANKLFTFLRSIFIYNDVNQRNK